MLAMVSGPVPEFVSVAVWAVLVEPTLVLLKVSVVGANPAVGTATPVPVSGTVCVEPDALLALSVTVIDAPRLPDAVGVNLTDTEQVPAGARVVPQVLAVIAKSPAFTPVSAMLAICKVSVPGLERVTLCAALLVPMFWLAN